MKTYILLCTFFNFGIGEEIPLVSELAELKLIAERQLNEAMKLRNRVSELDIVNVTILAGRPYFTELPFDTPCSNLHLFDDEFSQFSHEMNIITIPLNDWISQSSSAIEDLHVFIRHFTRFGHDKNYSELHLNDIFFSDCNNSLSYYKPEITVNTNDIYAYQSKSYCGSNEKFQCGSGECIEFNSTCDNKFDCWDGSDELGACGKMGGCEGCQGFCVPGPRGPRCLAKCPSRFPYSIEYCPFSKPCYSRCIKETILSPKCLVRIFSNLMNNTEESINVLVQATSNRVRESFIINKCMSARNNFKNNDNRFMKNDKHIVKEKIKSPSSWTPTTRHPTWHPTTHHPTWHPTSRHPTWHPTTHHPTWHPTSRHPTWHPTTHQPTWPPTSRHPTWHPTTHHPTWPPTSRHPTWHPTTHHPTWPPTSRHPTWHPTTHHPTWHPTSRHPTWHPTTRHPTWHPTSKHTTWNPPTFHPTWNPIFKDTTRSYDWDTPVTADKTDFNLRDSSEIEEKKHHTTKHTTPRSTTAHTKHTTRHHTTKHSTKHTTHHTTRHTTHPTTHHTTTPTTPTTQTTPHTTTTSPTTTRRMDWTYNNWDFREFPFPRV